MSDILSQNEIDALLHGVGDITATAETQVADASQYELYDLSTGINRIQGWMHDIKLVDERIQNNLGASLLSLLHKSVDVKREEARIQKFTDYTKTLYVPSSVNTFVLTGLHGITAIVLDAKLVYALVNVFFGGGSRPTQVEGREFTTTEQRVIRLVLKSIIEAIKGGWRALSDTEFRLLETEMNPAAISSYSATDVLVVRPFKVSFDGGGGEVQLVMPGNVVDAIFRNKGSRNDEEHNTMLLRQRSLRFLSVVTGELSGANLTIGELFKLAEGDIIAVDSPEKLDMKINGIAKFKARMGEVNGRVGLKVLS
jgi:flagellar motor switch protein FliM